MEISKIVFSSLYAMWRGLLNQKKKSWLFLKEIVLKYTLLFKKKKKKRFGVGKICKEAFMLTKTAFDWSKIHEYQ